MIAVSGHCITLATMQNHSESDIDQDAPLSKTRRKQEMHALQEIGEQLTGLDLPQLTELELPEILMGAILETRQIYQHGARRRQMQYIGKLMRKIDVSLIQKKLTAWRNIPLQQTAQLHLVERWRARLLASEQTITEFAQQYPNADLQHLRLLVRNTRKEKLANKPPKNYHLLFQELHVTIITKASMENT